MTQVVLMAEFEPVLFDEAAGEGAFLEVFEDQAAADAHRDAPHFAAFFDEIAEIDVTWSVRRGAALSAN